MKEQSATGNGSPRREEGESASLPRQLQLLSPAQRIVLAGIAAGKKPNQIVDDLPPATRVSVHGIRWHKEQIFRKLKVHTAVEAVRAGLAAGLI